MVGGAGKRKEGRVGEEDDDARKIEPRRIGEKRKGLREGGSQKDKNEGRKGGRERERGSRKRISCLPSRVPLH